LTLEDLLQLDKVAEKSGHNLLQAIEESKRTTLSKFIYALGIRHVGEHVARVLAKKFGTIEKLQSATEEELLAVHEVGDEIARRVSQFFKDPHNQKEIVRLLEAGILFDGTPSLEPSSEGGKTFVITGTLKSMKRSEAKNLINRTGGRLATSLSQNTDYLVAGESPGSKLRRAKELGIPIIQEEDFLGLLEREHGSQHG
jgi:DNA ligase (NAD+)